MSVAEWAMRMVRARTPEAYIAGYLAAVRLTCVGAAVGGLLVTYSPGHGMEGAACVALGALGWALTGDDA